jgi:hypothetical protein
VKLYSAGFALLVGATVALVLAVAGLLQSTWLLWLSVLLSALAIAAAAASVVVRR